MVAAQTEPAAAAAQICAAAGALCEALVRLAGHDVTSQRVRLLIDELAAALHVEPLRQAPQGAAAGQGKYRTRRRRAQRQRAKRARFHGAHSGHGGGSGGAHDCVAFRKGRQQILWHSASVERRPGGSSRRWIPVQIAPDTSTARERRADRRRQCAKAQPTSTAGDTLRETVNTLRETDGTWDNLCIQVHLGGGVAYVLRTRTSTWCTVHVRT